MKSHSCRLNHTLKSYLLVLLIGLAAGIVTRLTDLLPSDTVWSWNSIATLYGFWMLTVTLVILFSSSNWNAGLNVFLYLFAMSFSFYFLQYLLGLFFPLFDNGGFKVSLFIAYSVMSFICGVIGFILYFWNKKNRISNILYALPVGGLLAETFGVGAYFFKNHTFLFQLLFDLLSALLLGIWFYKKATHKLVYLATIFCISFLGYGFFYKPFL